MSKPFPLKILLDLARSDSDTAAARLVLSMATTEMEQRLQLLLITAANTRRIWRTPPESA